MKLDNLIRYACEGADEIMAKMVELGLVDAIDLHDGNDEDTEGFSPKGRELFETIYNILMEVEA